MCGSHISKHINKVNSHFQEEHFWKFIWDFLGIFAVSWCLQRSEVRGWVHPGNRFVSCRQFSWLLLHWRLAWNWISFQGDPGVAPDLAPRQVDGKCVGPRAPVNTEKRVHRIHVTLETGLHKDASQLGGPTRGAGGLVEDRAIFCFIHWDKWPLIFKGDLSKMGQKQIIGRWVPGCLVL